VGGDRRDQLPVRQRPTVGRSTTGSRALVIAGGWGRVCAVYRRSIPDVNAMAADVAAAALRESTVRPEHGFATFGAAVRSGSRASSDAADGMKCEVLFGQSSSDGDGEWSQDVLRVAAIDGIRLCGTRGKEFGPPHRLPGFSTQRVGRASAVYSAGFQFPEWNSDGRKDVLWAPAASGGAQCAVRTGRHRAAHIWQPALVTPEGGRGVRSTIRDLKFPLKRDERSAEPHGRECMREPLSFESVSSPRRLPELPVYIRQMTTEVSRNARDVVWYGGWSDDGHVAGETWARPSRCPTERSRADGPRPRAFAHVRWHGATGSKPDTPARVSHRTRFRTRRDKSDVKPTEFDGDSKQ